MLHRDLKPDNILLTDDRKRVKLADFGIATIWRKEMTNNQGTLSYTAPEVGNCWWEILKFSIPLNLALA